MKKIFALVAVLFLVVSVSGCVKNGGGSILSGLMKTGGETKEAPNDILKMTDPTVIPNPPIPASESPMSDLQTNSEFKFSFRVKNLYKRETANQTNVKLYDTGRCESVKQLAGTTGKDFKIFPKSTKLFKWKLYAPTNDKLGYMKGTCPLRYQTSYHSDAHTRSEAVVVTQERVNEASRSGESLTVSPSETKSRGPIKIDVRFGLDQPFTNESVVPFDIIVKNKGSGEVDKITNDNIAIEIPNQDFDKWKNCTFPNEGHNSKLPFFEGTTPHIRCKHRFKIKSSAPKKSYTVKVDIGNYKYIISGKKTVTIKPIYQE